MQITITHLHVDKGFLVDSILLIQHLSHSGVCLLSPCLFV